MPRISRFGLGNHDQCRAQHALGDQVTLLQNGDDGIGLLIGIDHGDGLVPVRVKLLASGVDLGQRVLPEGRDELFQGQFDAGLEALYSLFGRGQRGF